MTMLLINMREIKTHYSKVIGNEIIVREVIELKVKTKLEEGQGVGASCSWHLLAGTEGGVCGLCSEDMLLWHTWPASETRCWVQARRESREQMGGQC